MHNDCPAEFVSFVIVVRFGSECVFCSARGGEITCQPAKWLLLVKSQWIEVALVCCPCDCFQIHLHVPPSWSPQSVKLISSFPQRLSPHLIRLVSFFQQARFIPSEFVGVFHQAASWSLWCVPSGSSSHFIKVFLHIPASWSPYPSEFAHFTRLASSIC